jgi:glycerol uptake facilitator protein
LCWRKYCVSSGGRPELAEGSTPARGAGDVAMATPTAEAAAVRAERGAARLLPGLAGEMLSEFLGTFILIMFGCGSVAVAVAGLPGSGRQSTPFDAANWLIIAWGWGLGVVLGVYVAGGVSGAHINPAVTLAFAVRRKFPWNKVGPYVVAQVVGAFVGAALVYALYHDAIDAFNEALGTTRTGPKGFVSYSIFATFPAPYFHGGWGGPFLDQIVGTAFLVMCVVALIDMRNTAVQANLGPYMIGLVVAAIGMSFGANAGYAINPARDFGPRLFAYFAGWGDVALPGTVPGAFSWYFWIPIVAPLIGGVIGVLIYDAFIGSVLHAREGREEPPGRTEDHETAEAVGAR